MKKFIFLLPLLFLVGCVSEPVKETKSPLQLQAIQAKEFETTKKVAFAATLSVFQDLGYIVESASLETGLITAKSPTTEKFKLFIGPVAQFVKATAFVEEITAGRTKVRLNLVDSRNAAVRGTKREEERPIETPDTYQDFFTKVQQGIFIRSATQ